MALIIIDQNAEYTWDVDSEILMKLLDHIMRQIDPRSAFHELLFAAKRHGKLAFYQLGHEQKQLFEEHAKSYQASSEEDQHTVTRLIDMLEFSKNFDPALA